ncbi:unnamed protein product [Prorocentrum cordatum]|uniref:Uncharacterized protein n=1 Tax=Prorocentrum cordatum TaxID=2364126 RepID=A0ABN9YEG6_9DINO|nr:unnamed protein product [Polarella glacialis]
MKKKAPVKSKIGKQAQRNAARKKRVIMGDETFLNKGKRSKLNKNARPKKDQEMAMDLRLIGLRKGDLFASDEWGGWGYSTNAIEAKWSVVKRWVRSKYGGRLPRHNDRRKWRVLLQEFQCRQKCGTHTRDFGNSYKAPLKVFLAHIAEH